MSPFALFLLFALAPPRAADVQALEEARIAETYGDVDRRGRLYAEFAPAVETRGVSCSRLSARLYTCRYEVRSRDYFAREFGPWIERLERLERRRGCWRLRR